MPEASADSPQFKTGSEKRGFLRKTTLVDYPGKVASAFFFSGCGLRCPWCQNRELVLFSAGEAGNSNTVMLEDVLSHLKKRRSVLGGVVLSGGEPTGFAELPSLIETIRGLGLPVKLDTNGMNPRMLEKIFFSAQTRPDYLALDLKLPPERYTELLPRGNLPRASGGPAGGLAGAFNPGEALKQSALLIRESGVAHEYRTLALPGDYLRAEELDALAPLLDSGPWYFRTFAPGNCLDPVWDSFSAPGAEQAALLAERAHRLGKQGICP
jgi:pyruvate formate lyase activating enzyme